MGITVFGVSFLAILLYGFIKNNEKIMMTLLILGMCMQTTSVVVWGEYEMGPQVVVSIVFSIWILMNSHLLLQRRLVIKSRENYWRLSTLFIWLFFGYIVVMAYQNSDTGRNRSIALYILQLLQLLILIITYLSVPYIARKLHIRKLHKIIEGIIIVVVSVGILQFLITTNILPRNFLIETFIYNMKSTGDSYAYNLSYYPRIFSLFMEPSYCAPFLVGSFYYLISREIWNRKSFILCILVMIEIVLTFSSTAYAATLLTGIVYLLVSKNKKALKFLIPLGIVMVILLLITGTMQDILGDVIFNKLQSGSGTVRRGWDMYAMEEFNKNPLFGVGYKRVRGSQLYASVLGQLGIIGTTFFALSVLTILLAAIRRRNTVSVAMFLVATIISQIIAIPDLDFCVFWLSMYLVRLTLAYDYEDGNFREKEKSV